MNRRPRVLFTTPILSHPPKGGPQLRIENTIKALSRCSELYIHCRSLERGVGGGTAVSFYRKNSAGFFRAFSIQQTFLYKAVKVVVNCVSRFLLGRQILSYRENDAIFADVLKTARSIEADVIWLGFGNISYPLLSYLKERSSYPVISDTDSVWSRFVLRGLPYAPDEAARAKIEAQGRAKEEEERWGTRLADITTAVSEVDAEYYRSLAECGERVRIFSNVVDVHQYERAPAPPGLKTPSLFLAGTFGKNSPMDDAARWLINSVLPLIRQQVPDVHVYIAGVSSKNVLADLADDHVCVVGEVDSVLPYLTNAAVSVVPLRYESGTRFKILEAGACNIPVVSTTLGAEGIPVTDGIDILLADTPEDFAAGVVSILGNPQLGSRLASNLHDLVRRRFSIEALEAEAKGILEAVLEKPGMCENGQR